MVVLRVASWNVNGLRSYIFDHLPSSKYDLKTEIHPESNLAELIREWSPNLICFQETRCGTELLQKIQLPDWKLYNSSSQGTGARSQDRYSGVATLVHQSLGTPLLEESIIPLAEGVEANCQSEGRFLALIFQKFVILNTYVPNAGTNFTERTSVWDPAIKDYLECLKVRFPDKLLVWVGDLNVARSPYDVYFGDVTRTPKYQRLLLDSEKITDEVKDSLQETFNGTKAMQGLSTSTSAGFTRQERDGIEAILENGWLDSWKHLHPTEKHSGYTWWNPRFPHHRQENLGWRIDYCLVPKEQAQYLEKVEVLAKIGTKSKRDQRVNKFGSDHAPLGIIFREF
jgi:exonuclease III